MMPKLNVWWFYSLVVLARIAVAGDAPAVHIDGDGVPQASDWTVDRFQHDLADDVKTIEYTVKNQKHTATAVPLASVLKAAGVDLSVKMNRNADPKTKNRSLRLVVIVRGSDGYTTAISLAELLPEIGNRHAWLAMQIDGQPLPARDAPVNLILPDDVLPGRWVRGVSEIRVIDPAAPTTQPAR
jgi:hypothetical protein